MPVDVSNESEWRRFEVESWRRAMRERGLQLRFLDADQQRAVFDALHLPMLVGSKVHRFVGRVPRLARRLAAAALLLTVGYLAHDVTPAAKHVAAQLTRYYQDAACTAQCDDTAGETLTVQ